MKVRSETLAKQRFTSLYHGEQCGLDIVRRLSHECLVICLLAIRERHLGQAFYFIRDAPKTHHIPLKIMGCKDAR